MATQRIEPGEFSLIIAAADAKRLQEAAMLFASAFSLDEAIATQIVKSAPIIFAQKLTKSEVKAITPKLTEISAHGLEFRVTARVAQKMPKVNWPVRPQFTAAGSGSADGVALSFDWENNAFVCPGCGETFLFRRMGKLHLSEPAGESRAVAAPAKSAPTKPPPRVEPAPEEIAVADPDPLAALEGVEGSEPAAEVESLDLPEMAEEVRLDETEAATEQTAEEAALDLQEAPAGQIQPPDETATPEGGELSAAAEEAQAPAAVETPPSGDLYNVFLSKITDGSKRDKAAELISRIKKCSTQEAKDLTSRLVIPMAKNVPKEQAEDILNQFKKMKIFGRMTKVK
ncbi:MAG: hypothetical protein HYY17_12190 [Planctomycetes bacterium]|nr:hypothetical protein [Planctomycetota bacterium]